MAIGGAACFAPNDRRNLNPLKRLSGILRMVTNTPSQAPLISVVVPAYNAQTHILEALESIRAQEGSFQLEIIVVDDGSRDNTRDLVQNFGNVHLISQANAGPSAARNRGISEAHGEFVAFLDADDLWTPGKLTAQMAIFETYPKVGMVIGDCRIFDEHGPRPHTQFESAQLDASFWGHPAVIRDPYGKLFRNNYVPTGAAMLRKRCFECAGLFDESRRYVEDMDLWFRIALHCAVGYTTQVCELKREHANNVSADWERMTLAFIDVMHNQARQFPEEVRTRGVNVAHRVAFEYSLMGYKRQRAGDLKTARRRYLQALRAYPSIRPLYYWLRSWVSRV